MSVIERVRRVHSSMEVITPAWNPDCSGQEVSNYDNMFQMADNKTEIKELPEVKLPPNQGIMEKLSTAEVVAKTPERDRRIKKLLGIGPKYAAYLHAKASQAEEKYQKSLEEARVRGQKNPRIPRPLSHVLDAQIGDIIQLQRAVKEKKQPHIVLANAKDEFAATIRAVGQERIRDEISPYKLLVTEDTLNKVGLSIISKNGLPEFNPEEEKPQLPPFKITLEDK